MPLTSEQYMFRLQNLPKKVYQDWKTLQSLYECNGWQLLIAMVKWAKMKEPYSEELFDLVKQVKEQY